MNIQRSVVLVWSSVWGGGGGGLGACSLRKILVFRHYEVEAVYSSPLDGYLSQNGTVFTIQLDTGHMHIIMH